MIVSRGSGNPGGPKDQSNRKLKNVSRAHFDPRSSESDQTSKKRDLLPHFHHQQEPKIPVSSSESYQK